MIQIIILIIVAGIFGYAGFLLREILVERKAESAKNTAKQIIELAKKEAQTRKREVELEVKDKLYQMRQDFENQTKQRREEISALERRVAQKDSNIDKRLGLLDRKEKELQGRWDLLRTKEGALKQKESHLESLIVEEKNRLQKIASLSEADAREVLLSRLSEELGKEKGVLIQKAQEEIRQNADRFAKEIISLAIQRCAAEHTTETTVSVVNLPNDEMKGRIIGREGRNIRALELATGVDVIIDDTPGAVTLSSFDPIRREIARLSLEKLISDGRIHPGRIEEVVEKIKKDMQDKIREEGERAAIDAGVYDLHPELLKLLGKLKYRTSYGQNSLQHSKEVSYILGGIATELGLNTQLARRIGLLHDIGKSVDQQKEGTHAQLGLELAKKFGESEQVVNAIGAHHEEIELNGVYSVLAVAADAISAARPGARRETLETYIKRLEKLESIANIFRGVDKAYAIQAGREIRVIVQPERISDAEAANLSHEIRKKIEVGMEYPGQIKVTVIRETRAIDYAK